MEGWCYNNKTELTTALEDTYAPVSHNHGTGTAHQLAAFADSGDSFTTQGVTAYQYGSKVFLGVGVVAERPLHVKGGTNSDTYNAIVVSGGRAHADNAKSLLSGLGDSSYAIGGVLSNSFHIYFRADNGNVYDIAFNTGGVTVTAVP